MILVLLCNNGFKPMANSPEELEQIRAYGQALLGESQVPQERPVRVGEYATVSPLSIITRGLGAAQGRSALNFVERERVRQRSERAANVPVVGGGQPGIVQPQGVSSAQPPQQEQPGQQAGSRRNNYVNTLAALESGNNPNAATANGRQVPENQATYFGLGQFSRDLLQKYGVTNWRDPNQQRRAIEQHLEANNAEYRRVFGRDLPSPGHGYLLHQQGAGGGIALLQNPDKSAFDVLMSLPYYGRNVGRVRSAIMNNLPAELKGQWQTIKAGDFANQWISRFNQRAGFTGSQTQTADVGTIQRPGRVEGSDLPPVATGQPPVPPGASPIETGALPPTPQATAPTATPAAPEEPSTGATQPEAPIRLAQAQTGQMSDTTPPNYIGGNPSELPPGVPQAIAPDPQMRNMNIELQTIINQLRRPELLSGDEFNKLLDAYQNKLKEYRELSAPIQTQTAFGTATYDRATGQLMNFVPSIIKRPYNAGGVSGEHNLIWDRGRLRVVPIAPYGSSAGGGMSPGGSPSPTGERPPNPNVSPQFPPFPQTGEIADEAAWAQRVQALGGAAQGIAAAQGKRVSDTVTGGIEASQRVSMLNAIKSATQAISRDRLSGEALSRYQTTFQQYFRNFGPVNNLGFREFLDKLNAFLASEATQEISARGTNFEFSTLMRYNPNLFASHEGNMILIDYLIQEKKIKEALGNKAANLSPEEFGNWNKIVADYYEQHPIIIRMPLPNGTTMNLNTKPIPRVGDIKPDGSGSYTEEEVKKILDGIPRGQWFIDPRSGQPTPTVPPSGGNRNPQTQGRQQKY